MKVLVIGLTPSNLNGRKSPTIRTLNNWMNYLGIDLFCFSNLYPSMDDYALSNRELPEDHKNYKIIALGTEVSNELWFFDIPHHSLPHPSPLNRKLNDMEYIKTQLNECKEFLKEVS